MAPFLGPGSHPFAPSVVLGLTMQAPLPYSPPEDEGYIVPSKGYIALFMCLTTKAVHLELVDDLSAASFLAALMRFFGHRGRPSELWSDNATCFCRADHELREALQQVKLEGELIAGTLANQGIDWRFIPPGAPHFGGLWEAGVKSIKGHLRRVIGSRHQWVLTSQSYK
ncbi:uncharacterized protein LOC106641328 [Copidosoma floridanum]|uniref:uncharacterized protein LOC106641328 n=1 Tax=Copidosoma floridanum TaxID=29053 RepID=UPI0006C95F08|nr:uncharacterized protein LOC106641328 [Copidosoma floridanum]